MLARITLTILVQHNVLAENDKLIVQINRRDCGKAIQSVLVVVITYLRQVTPRSLIHHTR
jgi:hypothetical protein